MQALDDPRAEFGAFKPAEAPEGAWSARVRFARRTAGREDCEEEEGSTNGTNADAPDDREEFDEFFGQERDHATTKARDDAPLATTLFETPHTRLLCELSRL